MQHIDLEKLNRKNFRVIMNTLSMPGTYKKVSPLYKSGFLALSSVLLYPEVSYFLCGHEDLTPVTDIHHPKVQTAEAADYIFCDHINKDLLSLAKRGTFMNPEFSATLIFACNDFNQTAALLSGPGINGKKAVSLPCDIEFISILKEKNSNYPLGVEIFFLNKKNELLALSRTTKIEVS